MSRQSVSQVCVFVTAALAIVGGAVPSRAATTIYQDMFTGTEGAKLTEHTPDVHPAETAWKERVVMGGNWTLSAGKAITTGATGLSLPFTPGVGNVYTLSADLTVGSGTTLNWSAVGFTGGADPFVAWSNGLAWWGQRDTGGTFTGKSVNSEGLVNGPNVTTGSTNTYAIVLDTRAADWTASYLINGKVQHTDTYTGGDPGIKGVGIYGGESVTTVVDNFTLTSSPTPEETTREQKQPITKN